MWKLLRALTLLACLGVVVNAVLVIPALIKDEVYIRIADWLAGRLVWYPWSRSPQFSAFLPPKLTEGPQPVGVYYCLLGLLVHAAAIGGAYLLVRWTGFPPYLRSTADLSGAWHVVALRVGWLVWPLTAMTAIWWEILVRIAQLQSYRPAGSIALNYWTYSAVLAALIIASIAIATRVIRAVVRRRLPAEDRRCDCCGYPLRSLPTGTCPECGREHDQAKLPAFRALGKRSGFLTGIALPLVALALGLAPLLGPFAWPGIGFAARSLLGFHLSIPAPNPEALLVSAPARLAIDAPSMKMDLNVRALGDGESWRFEYTVTRAGDSAQEAQSGPLFAQRENVVYEDQTTIVRITPVTAGHGWLRVAGPGEVAFVLED